MPRPGRETCKQRLVPSASKSMSSTPTAKTNSKAPSPASFKEERGRSSSPTILSSRVSALISSHWPRAMRFRRFTIPVGTSQPAAWRATERASRIPIARLAPTSARFSVARNLPSCRSSSQPSSSLSSISRPRRRSASKCRRRDRKSTRLNSSHLGISYAVFCLKKQKHHLLVTLDGGARDVQDVPYFLESETAEETHFSTPDVALVHFRKPVKRAIADENTELPR